MTPSFPTRRSSDLLRNRRAIRSERGADRHQSSPLAEPFSVGSEHRRPQCPAQRSSLRSCWRNGKGIFIRTEEHTSELQSLMSTSYAVFSLKNKHQKTKITNAMHTIICNQNT